jgi:hypothetical protein
MIELNERGPESRNPICPIQKTLKCGEDNFGVVDLRQNRQHAAGRIPNLPKNARNFAHSSKDPRH